MCSANKCAPKCVLENPLVLLLDLLGILTVGYLLCYSLAAANVGSWSGIQNLGYYCAILTLGFYFCNVIWLMYFFHTYHRTHYRQARLTFVSLNLGFCYLLGLGGVYCFVHEPTKADMRDHLQRRYFSAGYIPDVYDALQIELKCCGVDSYKDYIPEKQYFDHVPTFKEFPDSCCLESIRKHHCGVYSNINSIPEANLSTHIHLKGCVKKSYEEIKSTEIYRWHFIITITGLIPPFFPILTIILIQLILCLTKPKSELPYLPSRRNSWEHRPTELNSVFKAPVAVRSSSVATQVDVGASLTEQPSSASMNVVVTSNRQSRG